MILCIGCEHGHGCPYTGEAEDLYHAMMFVWDKIPDGQDKLDELIEQFAPDNPAPFKEVTELVKKCYNLDFEFEFGYDEYAGPPISVTKCEKYQKARTFISRN